MPLDQSIIDSTLRTSHGEHAYLIVEKLNDAGFDAWWVGGCVRDMLLKKTPDDIDIATSALPEDIVKTFSHVDERGKEWEGA